MARDARRRGRLTCDGQKSVVAVTIVWNGEIRTEANDTRHIEDNDSWPGDVLNSETERTRTVISKGCYPIDRAAAPAWGVGPKTNRTRKYR